MRFDLSGLTLEIRDPTPSCRRGLETYWPAFREAFDGTPWLTVACRRAGSVRARRVLYVGDLAAHWDDTSTRFELEGGRAEFDGERHASFELGEPDDGSDYAFFLFLNLLLPVLAARLLSDGGLLIHAAGAVLDGRAFALVGEENAGKTTWAGLCREAGGTVVNDDVIVVRPGADGGFRLHGVPLRVRGFGPPPRGDWPLAGLLLPRHGAEPALDPAPPLAVEARVLANLLHVAGRIEHDPRVGSALGSLVRQVSAATLTFARDPGFVALLRDRPPGRDPDC